MEEEFKLMGQSFSNRGRRAIEMIKLMRELWSGETIDFQDEFYRVPGCKMYPRPTQPNIPIVWGGHSEATLKRVAQIGDGWHPTQISLGQLEEGINKLKHYCEASQRDPNSVLIIARPGDNYQIDAETQVRHVELGIDHLIVDSPIKFNEDPGFKTLREQMERVAEICGLQPRPPNTL